jgi:hypothetical protein
MVQMLSRIAESLITNDQPNNYQDVATSWLAALFIIAASWMTVMLLAEVLQRGRYPDEGRHMWGTMKTLGWIAAGLVPVLVTVCAVFFYSLDFQLVVGQPGLYKGIFVSGFIYVSMMLAGHLFGNLRRDLYHI